MLSGLAWSFFGRADVIVTAQGALQPDSEVRRFYAPVDGELANLYIAEGQPVSKGDVLARLNARGAIEAATNALQAQLKLEDAEREWRQFPEKKALLERKAATLRQAMELEEQQHEKRARPGHHASWRGAKGAGRTRPARTSRKRAGRATRRGPRLDKFERVFAATGGGGVSQLQVDAQEERLAGGRERLAGGAVEARRAERPAGPGVRARQAPRSRPAARS